LHSRSIICRLQAQRRLVDVIAVALTVVVLLNIITTQV